jgi:hypothetical protein
MDLLPAGSLLSITQLAITPVILISGEGALMITLTNRMARIVDRTRILAGQVRQASGDERQHLHSQLGIMWRRARLVRMAVTFAGGSMLVACCLVIAIFAGATLSRELDLVMVGLFVTSVLLLIAALVAFLRDIFVSLQALGMEVARAEAAAEMGSDE